MNKEEILQLILEGSIEISRLKILICDMNTVDIAEIYQELEREKLLQYFRVLPKAIASDVFANLESDYQQIIVEALTDTEIGEIMKELFVDDAVDFIEEMPASVVKRVLNNVQPEKRKIINQILQYPDDSAGSIMTTEFVDLREDVKVKEAFDIIRSTGVNKETIYNCYVIQSDRLLLGTISAKTLMLAMPNESIGELMDTNTVFAYTTDDREVVASQFQKYSLLAMPVVDKDQKLVGIITVDDIMDVIIEENTEDIEKMAAILPSDEPYLKTSVFQHTKNRIFWILILMLTATLTGIIISSYEESFFFFFLLMMFIPMLMVVGGNAGAQSSTLIIRGMAVGEIGPKDILIILWKEIRVGLMLAFGLGFINFIRIYIMYGRNLSLCLTVTLALCFTIIFAKILGGILPILAKFLKIDPAVMSTPLLTTIADTASLMIYFSIAKAIFQNF
jgi:magnesium transporter